MVPRLHKRHANFKGACNYILHDSGRTTSDRVAWTLTRNIWSEPKYAWFEMFDTYRNRHRLKLNAGVDMRGRDNKTPVLHYSLAWHADDRPDPEHMKGMAAASLAALGLAEHEAIITAHTDTAHPHVHVVVNTVHPYTGRTAKLKFSKLETSRWAEAYEKERVVHCHERVKNNARRREVANDREAARRETLRAFVASEPLPAAMPYVPVKDHSPRRWEHIERKELAEKMEALRAALDQAQEAERAATAARHRQEREALAARAAATLERSRAGISAKCKLRWHELRRAQEREKKQIVGVAARPLARALYLIRNRICLGEQGAPLSPWAMLKLFASVRALKIHILKKHKRQNAELARKEKLAMTMITDKVSALHDKKAGALRDRQDTELEAERTRHEAERKSITEDRAREILFRERKADTGEGEDTPALPKRQIAPEGVPIVPPAGPTPRKFKRGQPAVTATEALFGVAKPASGAPGVPVAPARAIKQAKSPETAGEGGTKPTPKTREIFVLLPETPPDSEPQGGKGRRKFFRRRRKGSRPGFTPRL